MADRFCVKFSEPGVLMKKNIATAALVVMPNASHNINLEDPTAFNAHLAELFAAADADLASVAIRARWSGRSSGNKRLPPCHRRAGPAQVLVRGSPCVSPCTIIDCIIPCASGESFARTGASACPSM